QWMIGISSVAIALYLIFHFIKLGASNIAPLSENHSTFKRLAGAGFAVAIWSVQFISDDLELFSNLTGSFILALTLMDAITEPMPISLATQRSMKGWRLLGPFLAPGWHTGVLFFFTCSFVWVVAILYTDSSSFSNDLSLIIALVSAAAMLLFPLLIIIVFHRKILGTRSCFGVYMLIQVILLVITIVAVAVSSSAIFSSQALAWVPIPSVVFWAGIEDNEDSMFFLFVALLWFTLGIIVPLLVGSKNFREMSTANKQIKEANAVTD
ncbi:MAG: hypothetical protein AAF226_19490, partial [Verrucomicrobiota bacterium]